MITLRPGRLQDTAAVRELMRACHLSRRIDPRDCMLAEEDGAVAGLARLEYAGGVPYLRPLAVAPAHQHQGIGRDLVQHLTEGLTELRLVARGSAVGFYADLGFLPMAWEGVAAEFQQECLDCHDRDECSPVPMHYSHLQESVS